MSRRPPNLQNTFSPNAKMTHVPTINKFQNVQFAYVEQSNSRDVYEGFDATVFIINDAGSPVLDRTVVSHFTLASSHLLKGIDLFDTIPGLKCLKK